jgi:hypothetical protein
MEGGGGEHLGVGVTADQRGGVSDAVQTGIARDPPHRTQDP